MIVELVFLGFLVSSCGDVKTEPDTIHTEPGTVEIQTKAVDVEPKAFNAEVTTVVEANAFHVEVNKEAFSISNPSLAIATSVNFAPETFKIVVAENAFKVTPVFKLMIAKEAFCVQPGAFSVNTTIPRGAIVIEGNMEKGAIGVSTWVFVGMIAIFGFIVAAFGFIWLGSEIKKDSDVRGVMMAGHKDGLVTRLARKLI